MNVTDNYGRLSEELKRQNVKLVAVSKTKPAEAIHALYSRGQRVFGENRVQELLEKIPVLPSDIEWHLIGHLQTNKVKYIVGQVAMIESVDSIRLLRMINKEAAERGIVQDILIQIKISEEASKFGFEPGTVFQEFQEENIEELQAVRFRGVMGIASFVDNEAQIRAEFHNLTSCFQRLRSEIFRNAEFDQISMGMSGDYRLAIEEGSTIVRIGSLLFGERS